MGLMRDKFLKLSQEKMSVSEYWEQFTTLSRYAPEDVNTDAKQKEGFLNGLDDELQCALVVIPFQDLETLADAAMMLEHKRKSADENRRKKMPAQGGSSAPRTRNTPYARPSLSRAPAHAPPPYNHYSSRPKHYQSRAPFVPRNGGSHYGGNHGNHSGSSHGNHYGSNNEIGRAHV